LLGPCPIHNYDHRKYCSEEIRNTWKRAVSVFTLEPACNLGKSPEAVKWMFDVNYDAESLGFSYTQIGQENSFFFWRDELMLTLKMQIDQLLERGDVRFMKMCDTGEVFKKRFPGLTPPTSVTALNNFDTADVQSIYYDSKSYTANLFRFEDKIFFRSLFLFDEQVKDLYIDKICSTFDAVYENLPVVHTYFVPEEKRCECGLMIDSSGEPFTAEKIRDGVLKVTFGDGYVVFEEDKMEIKTKKLTLFGNSINADVDISERGLSFTYKGNTYTLCTDGAVPVRVGENIEITSREGIITIFPEL
jgi:hypothetical protein